MQEPGNLYIADTEPQMCSVQADWLLIFLFSKSKMWEARRANPGNQISPKNLSAKT